jgi:hypothetical protein
VGPEVSAVVPWASDDRVIGIVIGLELVDCDEK